MTMRRKRWLLGGIVLVTVILLAVLLGIPSVRHLRARFNGNYPISFYGRVVDASGNPIAGVAVDFQIIYADRPPHPGMFGRQELIRKLTTSSDANGNFQVKDEMGYSISITNFYIPGAMDLRWAFSPRDPRIPPTTFVLDQTAGNSGLPDSPARRLVYPLSTSRALPGP
jgi:hypothetical protein